MGRRRLTALLIIEMGILCRPFLFGYYGQAALMITGLAGSSAGFVKTRLVPDLAWPFLWVCLPAPFHPLTFWEAWPIPRIFVNNALISGFSWAVLFPGCRFSSHKNSNPAIVGSRERTSRGGHQFLECGKKGIRCAGLRGCRSAVTG